MSNPNNFDLKLQDLKEASTDEWLMQQSLDSGAFDNLFSYLEMKSELLKDRSRVSKQIIQVILDASNALEDAGNNSQANKFMSLLGLIVRNEAANNRSYIQNELMLLAPDLTVMHGPFKGMRYPKMKSFGSTLAPKILGSYEKELSQVIEKICLNNYSEIVDIGCAEGYYAVGLAMRIPSAKVFAYDTNKKAIAQCQEMAQLNDVADRLVTGSFCDADALRSIPYTRKALIFSDCEGYEKVLFTKENVSTLVSHDLLIEVHDHIDIEISTMIRRCFENTHSIKTIQSIDDITKAHTYDYNELSDYKLRDKRELLAESRPHIMEWFYMAPHPR